MTQCNPRINFLGNMKMSCPTWSIPEIKTCPGSTPLCRRYCYARKASRLYRFVCPCRENNLLACNSPGFVERMVGLIAAKRPKFFRIHEAGDFFSQEYLDKWNSICSSLPRIKFLAFTKSFHLNYSRCPSNLQIVWSIWPDTDHDKVPEGPKNYTGDCGDTGKSFPCHGKCDGCWKCWFLKDLGMNVCTKRH